MARYLPDANVLLHALRAESPAHAPCRAWLDSVCRVEAELLLPEIVELALVRIATLPRVALAPRGVVFDFWRSLHAYPHTRRIVAGPGHAAHFREVAESHDLYGNDLNDAWLAALAREHHATLVSTDEGFRRFAGLVWLNPCRA